MEYNEYVERCKLGFDETISRLNKIIEKNDYLIDTAEDRISCIRFKIDDEYEDDLILFFGIDSDKVLKTSISYKGKVIGHGIADPYTAAEGAAVFNTVLSSLYYVRRHTNCVNTKELLEELEAEFTRAEKAYDLLYDLYVEDQEKGE
ncbi:MAG: hypothetical protein IJ757_06155 [Clostridiales bacterium]|nr:hypothetical protein [Clostridiales bacterium]